jgi:hypothetical protein
MIWGTEFLANQSADLKYGARTPSSFGRVSSKRSEYAFHISEDLELEAGDSDSGVTFTPCSAYS